MNIGYYAHHHGSGHCRQADKLAQQLELLNVSAKHCFTVFTSMPATNYSFGHIDSEHVVRLPDEHEHSSDVLPGRAGEYWQPECLHYSPVGSRTIQQRSHTILSEVDARQIELMIVDLSVEIALLCRTASIPYLYMRLPGERNDVPHRNAFQGALALLAPYPKLLESKDTPKWIQDKTLYLGFLPQQLKRDTKSNFINYLTRLIEADSRSVKLHLHPAVRNEVIDEVDEVDRSMVVTVIKGFGGHKMIDDKLSVIRQILPQAFIISLGPIEKEAEEYVDLAITVNDVMPFLKHSDLLVMACGLNAIGEACQFDTPLLVIPDERPHQEQEKMAEALINCGRAISLAQLKKNNTEQGMTSQNMLNLPKIPSTLVSELQSSSSYDFVASMATAKNIKLWFIDWLLPKLAIKPERHV